jgi:NAD(P)-dependent dehydrogenase (short-subunit alcohol dehydrogenase family)/pimeloyl-ACP methyl ester carboxylesterase
MSVTSRIESVDGVGISVHEYERLEPGEAVATIVCIHGYPDNHQVWDGVVGHLREHYRVVTYDVRGAGESDHPRGREAYGLERLQADFTAVIDAVSPDAPVHLLAHDWGSIQGWHFVGSPALAGRIASYTSVSGPDLDQAGQWLRSGLRHGPRRPALRQLLHSYYIAFFHLPFVPEALMRTTIAQRMVAVSESVGRSSRAVGTSSARHTPDFVNGIQLYRANMLTRLAGTEPRRTDVPVQVLAPSADAFVGVALQREAPLPWAHDLRTRTIPGGHWVLLQRPDVVARAALELIQHVDGAPEPRALAKARASAKRFSSHLAVITGAGGGMGRQTALELARQGADVVVSDIDDAGAKQTAELVREAGGQAWTYHLDVADAEQWESFAAEVKATHGVPDIVVNNAGIGMSGGLLETGPADWQRIVGINFWGVLHGTRLFGEQLVERGEGGHIVNIASAAAFAPSRVMVAYSTTKAAVLMLSECTAADLAREGVLVSAVCPGFVNTDISRTTSYVGLDSEAERAKQEHAVRSYERRNYSPERAARAIVASIGSGREIVTITPEARIFLALDRWAPWLQRRLARVDLSRF